MKNYLETSKWLRWIAAGAFGIMLVLNIMVSLDFEKGKLLPSLTLVELGNQAYAQSEDGGADEYKYKQVFCDYTRTSYECKKKSEGTDCMHQIGTSCP